MQINNRKDIRDFIVSLEQRFPVDTWTYNEIHFWPIIRIWMYFYLIKAVEVTGSSVVNQKKVAHAIPSPVSVNPNLLYKIKWRLRRANRTIRIRYSLWKYKLWLKSLKQKDNLYVGAKSHRVNFKGGLFNRFFDTLIEQGKPRNSSAILEYGYDESGENIINKDLSVRYFKGLTLLRNSWSIIKKEFAEPEISAEQYEDFIACLAKSEILRSFADTNKSIKNLLGDLMIYDYLFHDLLRKIKPKKIYTLCYYSREPMMLVSVANRLHIETIEMQHGPQPELHLAYGSWTRIPKNGFNTLPVHYWCWDESSVRNINQYIGKNKTYEVFEGGHPWVNYWKELTASQRGNEENFILYSLQPSPIQLEELFHPHIVSIIKQSSHKWYIRLHPRQGITEEQLSSLIKKLEISDKVNIRDANQQHLPQLLVNCLMNVTFSSGVTIEAALFNKKTILLTELGAEYFKDLLKEEKAYYIDYQREDFADSFLSLEQSVSLSAHTEKK